MISTTWFTFLCCTKVTYSTRLCDEHPLDHITTSWLVEYNLQEHGSILRKYHQLGHAIRQSMQSRLDYISNVDFV